ncbi:MAG: sugar transferase, partial [Actinomycetota bacterium]
PDILADALDTLVGDKYMREEMANAGRQIAFNYFDVRRTIAGVAAMYTEIARKHRYRPVREPRRAKIKPVVFPPRAVEPVAQPAPLARASNGNGNGNGDGNGHSNGSGQAAPEVPRRSRRSDVRRLVARIETPRRAPNEAPRHPEPLKRRWDNEPAIAARTTEAPVKERRTPARAIPAVKPKAPPRRTLPDTSPEVPQPPAHFRREAPVTAAQTARSVPMRVVSAPAEVEVLRRAPAIETPFRVEPKPVYDILKRLLDVVVASIVLVLGAPIWLTVALAIKLDSPGPALFRNTVIGKDGVAFTYFKFRSMRIDSGDDEHRAFIEKYVRENGGTQSDGQMIFKFVGDRRVTRIGKFIRKLSFDEIPQLLNVLRGEMSIVGPRPPLRYEYELYDGYAMQRLAVMPGLTGLQQVEARHTASFSDKIEMDLDYIRRRSLFLDIMIMLKSIPAALKGE